MLVPALIFALAFNPPRLFSSEHEIRFEQLTVAQGLAHNYVNAIIQDRFGFLWFGTEDGLSRYDGHDFVTYRPKPGEPRSLCHVQISALCEDKSGALWIGTRGGGLCRFDRSTETFSQFRADAADAGSLSSDYVGAIVEDRAQNLWIAAADGLNRFNRTNGKFEHYAIPWRLGNGQRRAPDSVLSIAQGAANRLWIGTANSGLLLFDPDKREFAVPQRPTSADPWGATVWTLLRDKDGTLWLGTDTGLFELIENSGDGTVLAVVRHGLGNGDLRSVRGPQIRALFEDPDGRLWIGTDGNGLDVYRHELQAFESYRSETDNRFGLSSNEIRSIFQDSSGVLWIGTDDGLNRTAPSAAKFEGLTKDPFDAATSLFNVHAIWADHCDRLWIGGQGMGLVAVDRAQKRSLHFSKSPGDPSSLGSNEIRVVFEDRADRIWVGTNDNGLAMLMFKNCAADLPLFFHFPAAAQARAGLSGNRVFSVAEDDWGRLWIGTNSDLNRYDPTNGAWVTYRSQAGDRTDLGRHFVYRLYKERSGAMWVGTSGGGLYRMRFDAKSKEPAFSRYVHRPGEQTSLSNDDILSIHQDRLGAIWVGTNGGGLERFDPKTEKFDHYTESDGLPNNVIYGILEDRRGDLWLSTNEGLARFNPKGPIFAVYDASDGLLSDEFNGGAFFQNGKGELFFGGKYGVIRFSPENIAHNPAVPPLVLTGLRVSDRQVDIGSHFNGRIILEKSLLEAEEISLRYSDRIFSLSFAALHYVAPEKNRYRYKLEGFDPAWIEAKHRHQATYMDVPAGRYVFKVQGASSDDVWNRQGISLAIRILPPFWQTVWFRGALFLFFAVAMGVGYKLRTRFLLRRKEDLEKLDRLIAKTRQAALIAHEINNPLFAINNSLQVVKARLPENDAKLDRLLQLMESEIGRVKNIVQHYSDLSKKPSGPFVPSDIGTILILSIRILKWSRKIKGVKIAITPKKRPWPIRCQPDSLQQVFMNIIQNAAESMNGRGRLTIRVEVLEDNYEIHFVDTGPGFSRMIRENLFKPYASEKQDKGTGLGLFVSYNIVKNHGGEIWVDDSQQGGAHLVIRLPKRMKDCDVQKNEDSDSGR